MGERTKVTRVLERGGKTGSEVDLILEEIRSPDITTERLAYLALNENPAVKGHVGRHRKTSGETCSLLSKDPDTYVKYCVTECPNVWGVTLDSLKTEKYVYTKYNVARHKNTWMETREYLLEDPDKEVRKAAREAIERENAKMQESNNQEKDGGQEPVPRGKKFVFARRAT